MTTGRVAIVDLGLGNLHSVAKAIERERLVLNVYQPAG